MNSDNSLSETEIKDLVRALYKEGNKLCCLVSPKYYLPFDIKDFPSKINFCEECYDRFTYHKNAYRVNFKSYEDEANGIIDKFRW